MINIVYKGLRSLLSYNLDNTLCVISITIMYGGSKTLVLLQWVSTELITQIVKWSRKKVVKVK